MPLILDNPETVVLAEVKIHSFSVFVDPELAIAINYSVGPEDGSGVQNASATFRSDEIAKVDPDGSVTESMKDALYKLLELRLGPGQIL